MNKLVPLILVALLAAGGAAALTMWLFDVSPRDLRRDEGARGDDEGADDGDGAPSLLRQAGRATAQTLGVETTFRKGEGVADESLPGSWPRFRGPHFDGISREDVRLARAWGPEGPPVLWSVDVAEGFAGPAVHKGRVYLLDYDTEAKADALRCLSLADGREIWRRSYPVDVKRDHGISRTVPAVSDRFVVTMGPKCHVTCTDAVTGDLLWGIDLPAQYGVEVPDWYAGQCPLIDQHPETGRDMAVLGVGADDALLIAVDCETGEVLWETPNAGRWRMTHSSPIPMRFEERRTYVYATSRGVVAVRARDGEVVWSYPGWQVDPINVPTPVIVSEEEQKLLFTGGYEAGSLLARLKRMREGVVVDELFRTKGKHFSTEVQTPVFWQNHVFGVLPKDAGRLKEQLACMDLEGELQWTSGKANRFGHGSYLVADGLMFAMNDTGTLTLLEPTPEKFTVLARAKLLSGPESWAPLALAGGRLLARDRTRLVALDVRAR